jgi:hypothetical protein
MRSDDLLDMKALDVTAGTWEDLKREVLADDSGAVAPLFVGDSRQEGVFLCGGCGCNCGYCSCTCISCVKDDLAAEFS